VEIFLRAALVEFVHISKLDIFIIQVLNPESWVDFRYNVATHLLGG
jgi:hypothetical protein